MDAKISASIRKRLLRPRALGCDAGIAAGLQAIGTALTPAHGLSAQNASLWALLRQHLDAPVNDFLTGYAHVWNRKWLEGFKPSTMGRHPPAWQPIAAIALKDPWADAALRRRPAKTLRRRAQSVEELRSNLCAWDDNLRFAIRSHWNAVQATETAEELSPDFAETLEALRLLISQIRRMRPETVRPRAGIRQRAPYQQVSPNVRETCQMCWRPTQRHVHNQWRDTESIIAEPSAHSVRYCDYHKPTVNPPEYHLYRADIHYQNAYWRELDAIENSQASAFLFRLQPPVGASESEQQKAVYDTIHCGVKSLRGGNPNELSFAEKVWALRQKQCTQADTARQLGVHRQAVSRALKKLETIIEIHRREAQIDPLIGEPFSLHTDATKQLFNTVRSARKSGYTTAQIAKYVGRFKYTVKAVERWLWLQDEALNRHAKGKAVADIAQELKVPDAAAKMLLDMNVAPVVNGGEERRNIEQLLMPLRQFLDDENVTEVWIRRPHDVVIERLHKGKRSTVSQHLATLSAGCIKRLADAIAAYNYKPLPTQSTPFIGWLNTGERVHIMRPAIAGDGVFHIQLCKPEVPDPP